MRSWVACGIDKRVAGHMVAGMRVFLCMPLLLLVLSSSNAPACWGDTDGTFTALAWQGENSLRQTHGSLLSRLRLRWLQDGRWWSAQLAYDVESLYGGIVRDPLFPLWKARPPSTYLDAESTIYDHVPWLLRQRLYRGWLQFRHGDWQTTVGRQRIAWGVGHLWNPTDRFNPVQPLALEPEEKTGVDAWQGRWNYSGFGNVQAVFAPGRLAYAIPRRLAIRWSDTFPLGDVSASWIRSGRDDVLGADFAGNLGDAGIHMEYSRTLRGPKRQWVLGADINHVGPWLPNGLYLAVEYFFNAVPSPAPLPAFSSGGTELQSRSHQLLGMHAGYDLTPLWRLEAIVIQDLERRSRAVMPSLQYSPEEDMEIQGSVQWFTGARGEFAAMNSIAFLRLQYYF